MVFSEEKSLYLQLYEGIIRAILDGEIKVNEQLPSRRALARHLGVSLNTVKRAYDQLVDEGYIVSRERSGYYVDKLHVESLIRSYDGEEEHRSENFNAQKEDKTRKKTSFDLNYSAVDQSKLPERELKRHAKQAIEYLLDGERAEIGYDSRDDFGSMELKEEIRKYLYSHRAVRCDIDSIIIHSSFRENMNLLFHLLDDSVYGIEDPGYLVNNPIFTMSKRESIPIPIDKYGFSVANLEKTQANVAVVTPNHQFPSGIIMGIRRSQRLINWANEKRNRYIIEDSYDSDFKYSGKPVAALKSLDHEDKVILSGSFSQTMGHFIRVAYLVLPKALKEKLALQKSISSTASRFDQEILSRFMGSGDFDRHLSRMNTYYRKKHDLIMKLAKNTDGIQVIGADAGLHVVLRLHGISKDSPEHKRFDQSLRQENIIMDTVDRYSVVATNTIDYIIGFGSIPLEQLKVAIEKLQKCIANVIN